MSSVPLINKLFNIPTVLLRHFRSSSSGGNNSSHCLECSKEWYSSRVTSDIYLIVRVKMRVILNWQRYKLVCLWYKYLVKNPHINLHFSCISCKVYLICKFAQINWYSWPPEHHSHTLSPNLNEEFKDMFVISTAQNKFKHLNVI